MKEFKVTYYGIDSKILHAMESDIQTYIKVGNKINFNLITPDDHHKNFCELIEKSDMDLLLIDLSLTPNISEALRILFYEINVKQVTLIGLWNQLENPNLSKWQFELGINIHLCYYLRDPGSIENLNLSLARLLNICKEEYSFYQKPFNIPIEIYGPIRVNYFDTENVQIESDIPIEEGEKISCTFPPLPDYPFKDFIVKSISKVNLNYPLEYQATLDYFFYDEFEQPYECTWDKLNEIQYLDTFTKNPIISRNLDESQVKEILIQFSKNKGTSYTKKSIIKRLVSKFGKFNESGELKNLIIDKNFTTFKTSKESLWKLPYKFILISSMEDNLNILNASGVQVLTYVSFQSLDIENFENSEEYVQLKTICSRLENLRVALNRKLPTILMYNLNINIGKLQELLNYENLVVKNIQYTFEDNLKFIKEFVTNPRSRENIKFYQNDSPKVYPNSISELSRGFLIKNIDLVSISENEIIFKSTLPLSKEFSFMFHLEEGLSLFATIYEIKRENDENIFHAIINSLNENEKTVLRKYLIKG